MLEISPGSMASFFAGIPDPLNRAKCRHKLLDILIIAVLGALCGAEYWTEVELFAREEEEWLRGFLELPGGIPSHDTFGRVFSILDPEALTASFMAWVNAAKEDHPADVIALDGKTSQKSTDKGHGQIEVRRVWCTEDIGWLESRGDWKGLKGYVAVETERIVGDKTSRETHFFGSSLNRVGNPLGPDMG